MKRYSYILLCAATMLAMVCCRQNDFDNLPSTDADPTITFISAVEATRATVTTTESLKQSGKFSIATFLTDDSNTHYYTDTVYNNGTLWTSGTKRYWPVAYDLNMYAYSPIEDFITINGSKDYGNYSLTYTCPSDIDDQVDLLVTTLNNQAPSDKSAPSPVKLFFHHALSGIKFDVEFQGESNVTLDSITINYVNIEKERTYSFVDSTWNASEGIYFDTNDGLTTTIEVGKKGTTSDMVNTPIVFDDIDNQLMIIPQPIDSTAAHPHYLSIALSYRLNSGDAAYSGTLVQTGVMALPAPDSDNMYKQGVVYTYKVKVNGKKITFGDVNIDDQVAPDLAYGNIDLRLIDTRMTAADIGYPTAATDTQYYYTAAQRVKELLLDGVKDFVVVGSMGANSIHTLGDGKLGFYGDDTSPFNIGAELAEAVSGKRYTYSVDLRGTYDYPDFKYANSDGSGETLPAGSDIAPEDDTFSAGLFKHVKRMTEIILPHGIMAIGNHAFEECDGLATIDIADVKHIELGAFQFASALKEVRNGELTRIHENAFDRCKSLETIDLSKVKHIDQSGFVHCVSLTRVDLSSLETIEAHAFDSCVSLTLKRGVPTPAFTSVADYSFSNCVDLCKNDVRIDLSKADSVGIEAFNNCAHLKLQSGDLDKLTFIDRNAFAGCVCVGTDYEIHLPIIDHIGTTAFANCTMVNVVTGLDRLDIINDEVFMACSSFTGYSTLPTNTGHRYLDLPLVSSVGKSSFFHTAVTDVRFADGKLTTIGDYAFNMCGSLLSVSGLRDVTSVGVNAFANCPQLERLVLPNLTDAGSAGGLFINSNGLKELSLPLFTTNEVNWMEDTDYDGVGDTPIYTTITSMLSSPAIEIIDLPLLKAEIENWKGFNESYNLHTVNLGSAISFGTGTFQNCRSLKNLDADSVQLVGVYAFQGCSSLEELILPEVTAFGADFINGCTSLKTLEMNKLVDANTTMLDMPQNLFASIKGLLSLQRLILPKVTGSIGGYGFFQQQDSNWNPIDNASLKYLDLSSIDEVTTGCFQSCVALEALDLRGATTVGADLFNGCTNLVRINLSGLEDSEKISGGLTWNFPNAANCEIWLSDTQAATASGNNWNGTVWGAVHSESSGVPFVLEP